MANLYQLNYIFQEKDPKDYKYFGPSRGILPPSVDLRREWGSIYDQGSLGSCVANSVSGCIRHVVAKQNDKPLDPSRLYIYYNTRNQKGYDVRVDSGVYIRDAYKSVDKEKVCGEKFWPYNISAFAVKPSKEAYTEAYKFRKFVYLTLDSSQLRQCLAEGYPISFGMQVYSSFDNDPYGRPGYVPMPASYDQFQGGHCITLVGYDDLARHYIFANSWSSNWGENGFGFVPYDYVHNPNLSSDFQTCRFFRSIGNLNLNDKLEQCDLSTDSTTDCDANRSDESVCDANRCEDKQCEESVCDANRCEDKQCDESVCDANRCEDKQCDESVCDVNRSKDKRTSVHHYSLKKRSFASIISPIGKNTLVTPICGKTSGDDNSVDNELVRMACSTKVVAVDYKKA